MAITFEKQTYSGRFPEIWRGEVKMLPGGFKPKQTMPVGTLLRRGTPVFVDFDERTAAVCKTAKVLEGGTTTKIRVPKGHYFAVGDKIAKHGGEATATVDVKEIDTSNSAYDVITTSAAVTGVKNDDILIEAVVDESKCVPAYTPNNIVGADKLFDGKGLPTIDCGYEALVLKNALLFPLLPEWVENGMCMNTNHSIKFITQ